MEWILIFFLCTNCGLEGIAIKTVYDFKTEEACIDAGEKMDDLMDLKSFSKDPEFFLDNRFLCIRADRSF